MQADVDDVDDWLVVMQFILCYYIKHFSFAFSFLFIVYEYYEYTICNMCLRLWNEIAFTLSTRHSSIRSIC